MVKKFSELEAKMSPERRASIAKNVKEALGDVKISNFSQI
jgi:hypothetical protein